MAKKNSSHRLSDSLRRVLLQFIHGKRFASISEQELMAKLAILPQHEDLFHTLLQECVDTGVLMRTPDHLYLSPKSDVEHVRGILHSHARGFGFVTAEDRKTFPQDIFIPKHLTSTAVDGDCVDVVITGPGLGDKGPEGRIVAIVTRSRTHIAGTVRTLQSPTEALIYVPTLGNSSSVYMEHDKEEPLAVGDRIVMEVIDWGDGKNGARTRFSHMIGNVSDATRDVAAAIELFQLRANFDIETHAESVKFGSRVPLEALKGREDLRSLTCFTIDPDTAKDFDDALSLTQDEEGVYHLGVHIADVSYYVRPGSAIDREAALRCNSTYFPGTCVPMLPSTLSENLCSLKEKVNRLTVSVLVRYSREGHLLDYRIVRSVIRSQKRFTYREAKDVLDGVKRSSHLPTLERMVTLCKLLKQQRQNRGSIELSVPELQLEIDPLTGIPSGTTMIEYDITHQMVEEYMLKANELVALHLTNQGSQLSYRVHDMPAEENTREFVQLARYFGFPLHDTPTAEELQELFRKAENTPYAAHLATSFIRSMRLALYSAENIGHYGLQLTHYCHFTSPIRRYVDLVIHRILFGDVKVQEDVALISKQCSDQERLSAKAENYVRTLKKLRLLDRDHQTDSSLAYPAIITRIKPFGIFFEINSLLLEGFLHISALGSDYFIFDALHNQLRGRHTGQTFRCTDPISVILERVDLIMLEATWSMVEEEPREEWVFTNRSEKRLNTDQKNKRKKKRKDKDNNNDKQKTAPTESKPTRHEPEPVEKKQKPTRNKRKPAKAKDVREVKDIKKVKEVKSKPKPKEAPSASTKAETKASPKKQKSPQKASKTTSKKQAAKQT